MIEREAVGLQDRGVVRACLLEGPIRLRQSPIAVEGVEHGLPGAPRRCQEGHLATLARTELDFHLE